MRGAIVHGALLAVMLIYGYRTWTRDKTVQPDLGEVVLWDRPEADLVSVEYTADKKIVKLERKGTGADTYWWGLDTTIEKKPKPTPPKPADAGSGSAGSAAAGSGSGSGSGSAAPPPPIEEEEVGRKTHEFPLGEAGDKLIKGYAAARALRDLGTPNEAARKDYKLDEPKKTKITVTFKDGARTFMIGGSVYGGSDKYAVDEKSGKAFVLSKDLVSGLEIGESSLHLTDPRGFDAAKIDSVTLDADGKSKTLVRVTSTGTGSAEGQQIKGWGDADTKKPNQTYANYIDNANNLRPTEYQADVKPADLKPVVKLTYKDERGGQLGTLTVYKHEKPGVLPEGAELDPANPPKGETEYFIMTEKTRVPALVRKDTAQRTESDIETVFSGKEPPPTATGSGGPVHSIDPHGNPFGKGPLPPIQPHGAPPPIPTPPPGGAPPAPGPAPKGPALAPALAPGAAPKAPAAAPSAPKSPAPAPAAPAH